MIFRNNTLIDNAKVLMRNVLKAYLDDPSVREIYIATGYWDLPAMVLLYDALIAFLERPDTKLKF